ACGAARLPLLVAVRLEDARQRHPNDRAAEVPAAAVRALVRSDADVRLVVTHADRAFVEEVHFGSTPEEAAASGGTSAGSGGRRRTISRRCSTLSASSGSCSGPGSRFG